MKINEKNLSQFATTPPVDLDGWLNKRGEVNKAWQRRWFVLKGNLLFYFDKRTDKEPLGVIILEGCTIELAEDGEQYCFKVIFHGEKDRSYWLAAETQELMEKWMKALTCAGYEYMKCMVAELQRQLEELDGNHQKAGLPENGMGGTSRSHQNGHAESGSSISSSSSTSNNGGGKVQEPKAPPRRHNPFNRPAPAVPNSAPAANTNGAQIRQKEFAVQRQAPPTTVTLLGGSTTAATDGKEESLNMKKGDETTPTGEEDQFSFGSLHAALGQSFMQDRLKRQQQEEELRSKSAEKTPEEKQDKSEKELQQFDGEKRKEDTDNETVVPCVL